MLPPDFYQSPTLTLARSLIGKVLVRAHEGRQLKGRIVEVEAYHQDGDRAAHSYSGQTRRNAVMFGPPGFLYVYFIYGMHYCMNVVTEEDGVGAAVLIRALEPLEGIETMRALRGPQIKTRDLTNGPAKCCQAFAIDRKADGWPLNGSQLFLEDSEPLATNPIGTSKRIGITKSTELPWRFYVKDNIFVSKHPQAIL